MRTWVTFAILTFSFFLLLTIPWILWPMDAVFPGVPMFGVYSLLALSLAIDLTEAILALFWSPCALRDETGAVSRSDCAVVMKIGRAHV